MRSLLVAGLLAVAAAMAQAQTGSARYEGNIPLGQDNWLFMRFISAALGVPPPTEFESKADHAQRVAAVLRKPVIGDASLADTLILRIRMGKSDATQRDGVSWEYDPERRRAEFALSTSTSTHLSKGDLQDILTSNEIREATGSYTRKTTRGKTVTIKKIRQTESEVVGRFGVRDWWGDEIGNPSIELSAAEAAAELPGAKAFVVAKPVSPYVAMNEGRITPEIDFLFDVELRRYALYVDVKELIVVGASGRELVRRKVKG